MLGERGEAEPWSHSSLVREPSQLSKRWWCVQKIDLIITTFVFVLRSYFRSKSGEEEEWGKSGKTPGLVGIWWFGSVTSRQPNSFADIFLIFDISLCQTLVCRCLATTALDAKSQIWSVIHVPPQKSSTAPIITVIVTIVVIIAHTKVLSLSSKSSRKETHSCQ